MEAIRSMSQAESAALECETLAGLMQTDEFRCSSCFLVHHRSQLATQKKGKLICRDCAA